MSIAATAQETRGNEPDLALLSGPDRVARYDAAEYTLVLDPGGQAMLNPCDPRDLDVWAEISAPSGARLRQNGFFSPEPERGTAAPSSRWKLRVAPLETGPYELTFYAKVRGAHSPVAAKGTAVLDAGPARSRGFVRVDQVSRRYLRYDSGDDYMAVGLSVAWAAPEPIVEGYREYFDRLAVQGCDYTRVWLCDWNIVIEPRASEYSEEGARQLEELLAMARDRGIAVLLTLDNYGSFMPPGPSMWGEDRWRANPYNAANGGPIAAPGNYWTDPEVERLYRNRLRYILARFGAYRSLLAVELFNEVNAPAPWIARMAGYGRSIDPHGHLWTASVGYPWGESYDRGALWSLPELDYVAFHQYQRGWDETEDWRLAVIALCREHAAMYDKPFLFEEIGLDFSADDESYDREGSGLHLRQAFWSAFCSGSLGIPMSHWKEYFSNKRLFSLFKKFLAARGRLVMSGRAWKALDIEGGGGTLVLTGIASDSTAVFWASNSEATWKKAYRGESWKAAPPCSLTIDGLADGRWRALWIDTATGEVSGESIVECRGGKIVLALAALEEDVACLLERAP